MADNIDVQPGTKNGRKAVATDEIDNVHHPEYKIEFGAKGTATPVDADNPLPTSFSESLLDNQLLASYRIRDELIELNLQMKILNKYMSKWHGEEITHEDIDDDNH